MRRVTQQGNAVPRPATDWVPVYHWIFKNEFSVSNELRNIQPVKIPFLVRFYKIVHATRRRPIIWLVVVSRLLRYPVD